ncbi:MAG: DUF5711 family protein [Lachnospiraceae bacterium]|nr:hypothetical protein [Candidatus Fimimorpha excrementavium]
MANDTNISREAKKKQLRRQVISSEELKKNKDYQRRRKQKRLQNWMVILGAIVLVAVVVLGVYIYETNRTYKTFGVEWEQDIVGAESSKYVRLEDGVVQLGGDGATCYGDNGETVWSVPYDMRQPSAAVSDGYLVIYDKRGQSMIICDSTGERGRADTTYPITSADISSQGVTIAVTEDKESSYISYFDSSGNKLEIDIKSPLASQGYPASVSISPNGQQLMVSYTSITGGQATSEVVFYDFEMGKDVPNRVVGAFQNYEESDTIIPFVQYLSDQCGVAVGDNMLSFFSTKNRINIEQKNIEVSERIQKVFYDDSRLGIVVEKEKEDGTTEWVLRLYSESGTLELEESIPDNMEEIFLRGERIVMYEASSCLIQTDSGKTRYENTFEDGISKMLPGGSDREYIIVGGDKIKKIRLK